MRFGLSTLTAALVWAYCGLAAAQGTSGSFVDAAARAIASNPEVEARFHAFRASRQEQQVARGGFLPQVNLSANVGAEWRRRPGVSDNDFDRHGAALSLNQMIYDGFATHSEVSRLGYASLARYFELLDTAESTALEAVRAHIDVQRYRELVDLAKDNYVQHRQVFDQIEQRVKAGVGRRVDLEQASGRLALAEANLLTESSNLHDVSARYQRVVGEVPGVRLEPGEVPMSGVPDTINSALREAYQASPGLAAAHENVRAARAEAKGKQAGYQPRVNLQASEKLGFDTDGIDGRHRDRVVELVLNYNLFRGGADSAQIKQYAEQLSVAEDLRDKSCRDLRQTLSIAYNDVARLGEQLEYLDQHQLSIAKAREAYRRQFDIGQRTLLDLLDTENEYFESRRAFVNATHDREIAKARTLASMGHLLKALELSRNDLPTQDELGQDREAVDVSSACPATAPLAERVDKQALLAATRRDPAPVVAPVTPVVPPVAAPPEAGLEQTLSQRTREWAAAWSSRDVGAYLAFYGTDFQPVGGQSRAAWERARRRLVGKEMPIQVTVDGLQVLPAGEGRATVAFRQRYTSGDYSDVVTKRLSWVREAGEWRIAAETAE
ncbi:MAG: TolC family outer membrane protein [Rhodocyclaceae bacterium]|nr:TolC family outer membrane protein [Rhodocyclaceae bacterium]